MSTKPYNTAFFGILVAYLTLISKGTSLVLVNNSSTLKHCKEIMLSSCDSSLLCKNPLKSLI